MRALGLLGLIPQIPARQAQRMGYSFMSCYMAVYGCLCLFMAQWLFVHRFRLFTGANPVANAVHGALLLCLSFLLDLVAM